MTSARSSRRDAFGRLIGPAACWSHAERVDELHRQSGRLLADTDAGARWLGDGLRRWLGNGGDLAGVLGVRAPRGSHATPWNRARLAEADSLLMRLAVLAGNDTKARAWLRGEAPAPARAGDLVAQLRELKAPMSRDAFRRARDRRRGAHSYRDRSQTP